MSGPTNNTNGNGSKLNIGPLLTVLTLVISFISVGAAIQFMFVVPIEHEIEDMKEMVLRRTNESLSKTERVEDRLSRWIEGEQIRNNQIEQRVAAEEAASRLLIGNKIKLDGESK